MYATFYHNDIVNELNSCFKDYFITLDGLCLNSIRSDVSLSPNMRERLVFGLIMTWLLIVEAASPSGGILFPGEYFYDED